MEVLSALTWCVTNGKAESEGHRSKPKGALESEMRIAISL